MRIIANLMLLCLFLNATQMRFATAADLLVRLENATDVSQVGVVRRWDENGDHVRPVDPKAKIESPQVTATGKLSRDLHWMFQGLTPGRYDVVIMTGSKTRIEGFGYPPVLEFDPFFTADQQPPNTAVKSITKDIERSRFYENKVTPLSFAGNDRQVRILVQLLRDKPTSFDGKLGQPAATLRHEVWQYSHRYGAWSKEKRTRVLDRLLMSKRDLRTWTWVWDPRLGMIEIKDRPVELNYSLPNKSELDSLPGLHPY